SRLPSARPRVLVIELLDRRAPANGIQESLETSFVKVPKPAVVLVTAERHGDEKAAAGPEQAHHLRERGFRRGFSDLSLHVPRVIHADVLQGGDAHNKIESL